MKKGILLAIALISTASAWEKERTSPNLGTYPRLEPTHLDYSISWNGRVNAGWIALEFKGPNQGTTRAAAQAASTGFAAKLFPYKLEAQSSLDPATLRPRSVTGKETEAKEESSFSTRWDSKVVRSQETLRNLKSGATSTKAREFHAPNVLDLFSALLHLRSQNLSPGSRIVIPVQPFDKPYLVRFDVVGKENHSLGPAIRINLNLQKINPKTGDLSAQKKVKSATIWLSDDKRRIPLEVRSSLAVGEVRVQLTKSTSL